MAEVSIQRHSITFQQDGGLEIEFPVHVPTAQIRNVNYNADGLKVWSKSLPFLEDPKFQKAYSAGMNSGHRIMREPGSTADIHVEYRVYILIWAATIGARLQGDFVECGVNTGIYSLAICDYLDFAKLDRKFYLFDTFSGVPDGQATPEEAKRVEDHKPYYFDCLDVARKNFAPYPNAVLVPGAVPDTLSAVDIDRVAYLSIDMNLAYPERAAMEFFWEKLVPGALVIFDDYAWSSYVDQRATLNEFAAQKGTAILTLPTGQGMMIKT